MIKVVLTEDASYVYVRKNSVKDLLKNNVHSGQLILDREDIELTNICSIENFNEIAINMDSVKGMYSFIDEDSKLPLVDRMNPSLINFLR